MVSETPMVVLASANAPFNNFRELVAQAKEKPGQIGFSTPGSGSINHLAGEWLAQAAGLKLLHVPYPGSPQAITAVIRGDVQMACLPAISVTPHAAAGSVRLLAVSTARRSALLPDVPTLKEGGVDESMARDLVTIGQKVRNLRGHGLEEGVSTRLLIYAAQMIAKGISPIDAAEVAICSPITDDRELQRSIREIVTTII